MESAMELLLPPILLQNNPEVHTAQLATAPPQPQPKHNHPPYAKMILTAIKTLNEKKGSSRKAIAKFIDSTYSNLPVSHSALLTHHLKRLKKKGIVLMVKYSYKLPKSRPTPTTAAAASSSDPLLHSSNEQKRGRGRPPKPKPVLFSKPKRNPKPKTNGLDKGRKPRGRPRKDASSAVPVTAAAAAETLVSASAPAIVPPVVLRKRGRPRGPSKIRGAGQNKPMKPKRVSNTGRQVGRPKIADGVDGIGVGDGGGGVFLVGSDGGNVGGGGEMKRGRGRPPKKSGGGIGGGVVKTRRVSTGRPAGRPRKVSAEGTPAAAAAAAITTSKTDVNEDC